MIHDKKLNKAHIDNKKYKRKPNMAASQDQADNK